MRAPRILAGTVAALLAGAGLRSASAQPLPRPRAAITAAGPGVVVGDWRLGVTVTTGTDDSSDSVNNKERARVRDYSAAEARRQGQVPENPAAKLLPGAKREPPKPLGPGFAVARKVQQQLDEPPPSPAPERRAATSRDKGRHRVATRGAAGRDLVTQRAGAPRRRSPDLVLAGRGAQAPGGQRAATGSPGSAGASAGEALPASGIRVERRPAPPREPAPQRR